MLMDRRSGQDRRKAVRLRVNFNVEWEDTGSIYDGIICDLSVGGCFILCSADVEIGKSVQIYLSNHKGLKIPLRCEVVNSAFEIGIGLKFVELSPAQKEFLEKLVTIVQKKYRTASAG